MKMLTPKKATKQIIGKASALQSGIYVKYKKGWAKYPEPEGKQGEMKFGCADARPKTCPYILRLERDLANSYYWSGNFCQDYFFFVANWHPIISIFVCHPNHPWTKLTRFQMLIISLAITMVPSAVITAYFSGTEYDEALRFVVILTCVTVPDVVYGVVLYQLAIGKTRCFGQFLKRCWLAAQYCCLVWVFFFVLLSMGICYAILHAVDLKLMPLFRPILEGRLYSAVIWFPIWIFLPCQLGYLSLWYDEEKKALKNAQKAAEGIAEEPDGEVDDASDTQTPPEVGAEP